MTQLSAATLAGLDPRVATPPYDRDRAGVGVVHLVGAFHRAHQAVYLDDILARGHAGRGICGVGVLAQDRQIRDILGSQDHLYTLLTVDPDGTGHPRIVGSHLDHLHVPDDPRAVLDRLARPETRIVSLTITEGGYGISDSTGAFEPSDPATLADLAGAQPPTSVWASSSQHSPPAGPPAPIRSR